MQQLYILLPSFLLIAANLVYLYTHGFQPLQYHPHLALYNFSMFVIVGIFIFLKTSYHLNKWFVLNQGTNKYKFKQVLKQLLFLLQKCLSCVSPHNQTNLIYLYFMTELWNLIQNIIPITLMGIFLSLLFQLNRLLNSQYASEYKMIMQRVNDTISKYQRRLPRYNARKTTE